MQTIALFTGSFDPFTIGHADITQRGLSLFDKLVVGVGWNVNKQTLFTADERVAAIQRLYANEPRISVKSYEGLTADFAQLAGATHILRGIRSVKDFEYERDMAAVNQRLTGIETVLLFTSPSCAAISSGLVRELLARGKDISEFIPDK